MTGKNNDKAECGKFRALIEKRLDRETTPEEDRELDNHLASCQSCREEMSVFLDIENLLHDIAEDDIEIPADFFETLESGLETQQPMRGFQLILSNLIIPENRVRALGIASVVLVFVLTLGVGRGIADRMNQKDIDNYGYSPFHAMIQTNAGETIFLSGDEGEPDKYSAALDDLERAYLESVGRSNSTGSEGYIHTSWSGGDAATPIH